MAYSIPGYTSVAEFARQHGLAYMTVANHLKRGHCAWPRKQKAGNSAHPLYKTWESMKQRCNNENATKYNNYGGRGISVCARWNYDFWSFVEDMGARPEGRTLDRVDNDGNYEPTNCRWATPTEQAANSRPKKRVGKW